MKIYVYILLFIGFLETTTVSVFSADATKTQPEPNIPADTKITKDIEYARVDDRPLLLDIYAPKSAKPLPVLIFVHGGGWAGMSKEDPVAVSTGFLKKGYAIASINYRLTDRAVFPAQIHDCKAAIRFLRANAKQYNLDPKHFGTWGVSAGGHLAALLGTTSDDKCLEGNIGGNLEQSSAVQAVCVFCGPTDLTQVAGQYLNSFIEKLLGGTVAEKHDLAVKASPITYVDANSAPFLIVHGNEDSVVDVNQSKRFYATLKKAEVQVDLNILPKTDHTTFIDDNTISMVEAFFNKHLKKNSSK